MYLNEQVVGHFLLFNVPSADLAYSCDVLETAPVSPFLVYLFQLVAKQTVLFNNCDLGESTTRQVYKCFSKPEHEKKPQTFRAHLAKPSCVGEHPLTLSHQLLTEYVLINWHEADHLNPC